MSGICKTPPGCPPAARCDDLVLQIVCPYFVEPHAAADFGFAIAQRLQALIAVLCSHLAGLGVIDDLDYRRYRSFILLAQFANRISISKNCPSYIALVISGERSGFFPLTYSFIPFVIRIEFPVNAESILPF